MAAADRQARPHRSRGSRHPLDRDALGAERGGDRVRAAPARGRHLLRRHPAGRRGGAREPRGLGRRPPRRGPGAGGPVPRRHLRGRRGAGSADRAGHLHRADAVLPAHPRLSRLPADGPLLSRPLPRGAGRPGPPDRLGTLRAGELGAAAAGAPGAARGLRLGARGTRCERAGAARRDHLHGPARRHPARLGRQGRPDRPLLQREPAGAGCLHRGRPRDRGAPLSRLRARLQPAHAGRALR